MNFNFAKEYFYNKLYDYLSVYIFDEDKVVTVDPLTTRLVDKFSNIRTVFTKNNEGYFGEEIGDFKDIHLYDPEYILLNGCLHFKRDIQSFLNDIHSQCHLHIELP